MRDRTSSFEKSGGLHCIGNVGTSFLSECSGCGTVVLAFYELESVFEFGDARDFFAARVVVREGNDGAIFPDKGPDDMGVVPSGFRMEDARALRVFESELCFVVPDKRLDDGFGIRCIGRWVDVNVVNWPIRPTVLIRRPALVVARVAGCPGWRPRRSPLRQPTPRHRC